MQHTSALEPASDVRSAQADGSWMAWTAGGIVGIWIAVALISVLAPDLVTGSEQQRLPIAATSSWLWGLISTFALLWAMSRLRGSAERRPIWIGMAVATLGLWLGAAILSVTLPVMETGSDPTRVPIGAMIAPAAAAMLTVLAGVTTSVFARPPERR